MQTLLRSLALATFIASLAACGGSSGGADNTSTDTGQGAPAAGTGSDGAAAPVAVTVLPKIYIATAGEAEVTSTDDYLDATIRIVSASGTDLMQGTTEIRGRGNTTWGMPKKPYKVKLTQAAPLLGMPAERDWALLANYADKSLVRNKFAMNLGQQVGLSYNPRSEFVELYFNNEYQGVYELYEHKEVGADRINVEELDPDTDSASDIITGGYYLEVDHRLDEDVCWFTSMNVPICSKDPEYDPADILDPGHPSSAQYNYITNHINSAEQAINTPGNTYEEYFDVDAMVNWYLVSELMKNNDGRIHAADPGSDNFTSSVLLHKPRGGKLKFGPLWDFDIAAGNINYNGNEEPTGWYIRNSDWHGPLFENSDFGLRVFAKWCQLRRDGVVTGIGAQVDAIVEGIDRDAIDRNFDRWDILGTNVGPNSFVGNTYQEEVDYLKNWLTTRADWMHAAYVREFGECPAS